MSNITSQCCSINSDWVFVLNDGTCVGVCSDHHNKEELGAVSKGVWNVKTGVYEEFSKLEIVA